MAEVYQMELDKVKDLMGEREKKNILLDLVVRKAAEFVAENAKEGKAAKAKKASKEEKEDKE